MSNKYTASKQGRSHGAYRARLEARGLSKAPKMPDYGLRVDAKVGRRQSVAS